jgi:intein/homing endonuclease
MNMTIESGMSWIEDPTELNLKIDELQFEKIESISLEELKSENVYDLEIDTNHNYIVDGLGIVHNGGGK